MPVKGLSANSQTFWEMEFWILLVLRFFLFLCVGWCGNGQKNDNCWTPYNRNFFLYVLLLSKGEKVGVQTLEKKKKDENMMV